MGEEEKLPDFLSAADLVLLRKPAEEVAHPAIGQKYNTRTESSLEDEAMQCALESHKNTLLKKKTAKICDIAEAEWNEERNAVVVSKLKGKFVQHMGRMVEGRMLLSPEESIFLLENGTIEIKKGQTLMSTEEAYSTILTGELAHEKYQVYSHLSQLGFIVIPHQETLRITRYEKKLNLNKHKLDKKRKSATPLKKPPEKRINFSGAFDSAVHDDASADTSENQDIVSCSKTTEDPPSQSPHEDHAVLNDLKTDSCEVPASLSNVEPEIVSLNQTEKVSSSVQENNQKNETGQTETLISERNGITKLGDETVEPKPLGDGDECAATSNLDCSSTSEVVTEDKVHDGTTTEFKASSENVVDMEAEVAKDSAQEKPVTNSQVENVVDSQINIDDNSAGLADALKESVTDADSQAEVTDTKQRVEDAGVEAANDSFGLDNAPRESITDMDSQVKATNHEQMDENAEVKTVNAGSDLDHARNELVTDVDSQEEATGTKQSMENATVETVDSDFQSNAAPNEVEIMDVDSQLTETSCNISESSKEAICLKVNEDSVVGSIEEMNTDSNDVLSCSSTDDESEILSLGVGSDESLKSADSVQVHCLDEDITLVEVTKTEKVPLAVIELDSDEEPTANSNNVGSDDEIMVVKECSGPSQPPAGFAKRTHFKSGEMLSRQFYKKEERTSDSPSTLSSSSAGLVVEFPRLFRTQVVCIPRPPLNLLPCHVKPAKEAYVIDLKQKSDITPQSTGRVWNSVKDMQDYQRQRRLCRSSGQAPPRFQDSKAWNRNFQNSANDRDFNRNFNNTQNSSPILPFMQNTLAPNSPWANTSNNSPNNSFIGSRHQQVNVSMSQSYHQLSPNNAFPFGNQNLMAQGQNSNYVRTVHSIASDVVSVIFNQHLNTFQSPLNAPGSFNSNLPFRPFNSGNFGNAFGSPNNSAEPFFSQNQRRNFRPHRGVPFPCHYRGIQQKRSWEQIKTAMGQDIPDDKNAGSDVEEVPISPSEVLWDPTNVTPLVKPGTRLEVSDVLKSLQKTQLARLTEKLGPKTKSLPDFCSLEISFDVYLPGFNYRKTCPDIPKHRVIVARSIDPLPKYSEIAFLQKKWNDGALLQIAVVDNGDISFQSFTSVNLPALVPHETPSDIREVSAVA